MTSEVITSCRVMFSHKNFFVFDWNKSSLSTFSHCRRDVIERHDFGYFLTVSDLRFVQLLQTLRRLFRLALQDVLKGDDGSVEGSGVATVLARMPEVPVVDDVCSATTCLVMSAFQVQLEHVQLVLDVRIVSTYVELWPFGCPLLNVVHHRGRQICFQEQEYIWSWFLFWKYKAKFRVLCANKTLACSFVNERQLVD